MHFLFFINKKKFETFFNIIQVLNNINESFSEKNNEFK